MFVATALLFAAVGSGEGAAAQPSLPAQPLQLGAPSALPPLRVLGAPVRPWTLGARSEASIFRAARALRPADDAASARMQRAPGADAPAGAAGGAPTGAGAPETPSGDEAPAEGADGAEAAEAPPPDDEDEVDISALRVRSAIARTHRALGIATVASVGATTILGTILSVNQATLLSPQEMVGGVTLYRGACERTDAMGNPGGFACGELTAVHRISSIISVGLYATTGGFALAMPDPERVNQSNDRRGIRLRIHKIAAWTHLAGMVLQPILGIFATSPNLVGLGSPAMGQSLSDFRVSLNSYQATMRTVHSTVGYVTFAALATAMVVELIP